MQAKGTNNVKNLHEKYQYTKKTGKYIGISYLEAISRFALVLPAEVEGGNGLLSISTMWLLVFATLAGVPAS